MTQKKEELFKQGNPQRWDICPEELKKLDKNELCKNREYAFPKMLTKVYYYIKKETQHVDSLRQFYGFYTFQLTSEYDRIRNLHGLRHTKHIVEVSQRHSDILADVNITNISYMLCGQILYHIIPMFMILMHIKLHIIKFK